MDDGFDNGQAETRAAGGSRPGTVGPGKPAEHLGQKRLRNARAVVLDGHLGHVIPFRQRDPDRGAGRRVHACVRQQIHQHLLQPLRVAGHLHRRRILVPVAGHI